MTTSLSWFGCNGKTLKWRNCGVAAALADIVGKQCAQLIIMHPRFITQNESFELSSDTITLRVFLLENLTFFSHSLPRVYLCNMVT